jgi:hypothetical protein
LSDCARLCPIVRNGVRLCPIVSDCVWEDAPALHL